MFKKINGMVSAVMLVSFALTVTHVSANTLDDIKKNGFVRCGVSQNLVGFSSADKNGKWSGLDVDVCRALAAAVLGDAGKVKYRPLTEKDRFTTLQSGEIDILSRNTTWTLARDTALNLNFAGVNYFDGQGFMVRKSLGLKNAKELEGATICLAVGTTTELNLSDFFRENKITFRAKKYDGSSAAALAYDKGQCDAFTTDLSALASRRVILTNPDEHVILPNVISKEPLGPVVRHGDDQWLDLVKWTLFAMLEAEEYGVTSMNVDTMKNSKNPTVRRLLGVEGNMGQKLGVDDAWAYRIISQIGNYAESYEHHVGPKSKLKLPRGVNALWKHGGLHYPMPIR